MLRISRNSVTILNKLLKEKSCFVVRSSKTATNLSFPYLQSAHYSTEKLDLKSRSPLGTLIHKDAIDKNQEQADEEEARKAREDSWRKMKLGLVFCGVSFTFFGGYLIFTLGAPDRDLDGEIMEDDLSGNSLINQYLLRTYRQLDYYRRLIKEPSREKLLPDPLEYPYLQPKYTLVLELTDVLVHPDWTYKTGWRFKKRPGLDYFLEALAGTYEIVIYTAEQGMTVIPLIDAIDPKNIISYKLVRDATHFTGGHHVKSLNNLNRDLSKVIVIDWNAKNVKFNPENLFNIKRWGGNDDDTSLMDLVTFLKTIADNEIEDVRDVLQHYSTFEDPVAAFREKQKRLIDALEAQAAAKKEQESSKVSAWKPTIFTRK